MVGDMDMNYLDVLGAQIRSRVPKSDLPDEDTRGLFRIYAVLLLAKGPQVTPEDVHNAWAAWMSETNPSHEAIVPFSELPPALAEDDLPYADAIRLTAEDLL